MKKWMELKDFTGKSRDVRNPLALAQKDREEEKWDKQVNILLVDDRRENLLSLEAVLDSPDYRLVSVQTGQEALRWVLKEEFALILLDVQMPGLNGFETARLIRQREKSSHIPIIFVTAISKANEHVEQGYAAGAIDYIFKPFHAGALKMKVERFVQLYRKNRQIEYQRQLLHVRTLELQDANERNHQAMLELQNSEAELETLVDERTQELRLSQELFQKIFQASPCLIAIRACEDGRYLDVNHSWLEKTGYCYEEVKNCSSDRIVLALSAEHRLSEKAVDLCDGIRNEEVHYLSKTGDVREGLLSTESINVQGESCILSVITDITERVYLEKEMARLDRLHLIGEMAAGIAHEIRNPMTTVRGFLQLGKIREDGTSPPFLDIMITELDRANTIITEFLTLAKNKTTDLQRKNLHQVIEPLLPLVEAEASLSGKNVLTLLEECPPIDLDEKEIRQLFLNLTLNGLEAMKAAGTLSVKMFVCGEEVVMEIADEGQGINEELLDKIWTPFFTTKEHGTGLGLAVCYSIAARHHARIDVRTSSEGTVFRVTFAIPQESNGTEL